MRAVDTNVLVRLVTRDDSTQVAAAEEFIARGGWVSHLVLAEALRVLAAVYERDGKALAQAVDMLLEHEHLTLQEPDVVRAALHTFRSQSGVDFSDCLVVAIARRAGHIPVGTFDRQLGRVEAATRLGAR